jgi:hypothetical protein
MPQLRSMWHHLQELRAQTQERRQDARRACHEARLAWLMPGATHLTRAITAAILEAHGLLDEHPVPYAGRTHAAILSSQAASLRHEVELLCAQARALCREAEILCKDRPAPASWRQTAGGRDASLSSTGSVCRGASIPAPVLQQRPRSVISPAPVPAQLSSIYVARAGNRVPAARRMSRPPRRVGSAVYDTPTHATELTL